MNVVIILAIVGLLWVLIEVLSVVFKMTGLEYSKARFQVISILTHTGFTTRESELIVQHPLRRRLASILMIISYIIQVALISVLIDMFMKRTSEALNVLVILGVVLVFIIFATRNKYISGKIDRLIERMLLKRIMKRIKRRPVDKVLKISPEYGIYDIIIDDKSPLRGVSLKEAQLPSHYIHVLKIDRGAAVIDFPDASVVIQQGDRLIVYGRIESIQAFVV